MTKTEHLLTILAEECIETAHRVSKAIRFTLDEIEPGQSLTNGQRIIYEFNDIVAVMQLLKDDGLIPEIIDAGKVQAKKERVKKYMAYSEEIGTISTERIGFINEDPKEGPFVSAKYNNSQDCLIRPACTF